MQLEKTMLQSIYQLNVANKKRKEGKTYESKESDCRGSY